MVELRYYARRGYWYHPEWEVFDGLMGGRLAIYHLISKARLDEGPSIA